MSAGVRDPLLARLLTDPDPAPFALVHRPDRDPADAVELFTGALSSPERIEDIELGEPVATGPGPARQDVLVVVPYRQVRERGFHAVEDGTPLLALYVDEHASIPLGEVVGALPDEPVELEDPGFDLDDAEYVEKVRRVIADEIGTGQGANFVLRRTFRATISGYQLRHAFAVFRRLLEGESGAYWTFLVHTGDRVLVGASPERHVSSHDGRAVMNPISGTYRYPSSGPVLSEVIDFLGDDKEIDELYMVLDEELKMMARICDGGGRVVGPYLREMARLAHTEYYIGGPTDRDPREILRETLFAPTVVGSPLENACRVIARHEPEGRGYYSGVVGLIGRDERGGHTLDSTIMIRTATIDRAGRFELGVGATLVRHSDATAEAAETHAKAAGLLSVLDERPLLGAHPAVREALAHRNARVAGFWLAGSGLDHDRAPELAGRRALVVDAEDTFTDMLAHQLSALGLVVSVVPAVDTTATVDPDADVVVLGPGPGDPRDRGDPRIAGLHAALGSARRAGIPVFAECLSHQVLCSVLGLPVERLPATSQGRQRDVDLFGVSERVGFYNSFAAHHDSDTLVCPGGIVELSRDPATGVVHALRGPGLASVQFHTESVLTTGGPRLVGDLLADLVASCRTPIRSTP